MSSISSGFPPERLLTQWAPKSEMKGFSLKASIGGALMSLTMAAPAFAQPRPVWIDVSVQRDVLDAAALRDAIGKELDCAVVEDQASVHEGEIVVRRLPSGKISVAFLTADREAPLRRVVALPRSPENRVQMIAWIVGNMARNEAAEWLASHRRTREDARAFGTNPTPEAVEPDAKATPDAASQNTPEAQPVPSVSAGNAANKRDTEPPQRAVNSSSAAPSRVSEVTAGALALRAHAVNLVLWHGLLELRPDAETSRFALQLGVGYGRVGAIRGFGFDLLHHRVDYETRGISGSLVWTRASATQGLAWSLGVVTAKSELRGLDYAGLVVYREGDASGVQLATFATYTAGQVNGGQAAALFTAAHELHGLQLAWVANVARDVVGAQASAVNVARNVNGLQFGLVNVARHVDGVQVGLVNVADNVRTQVQMWAERNYLENVGVRYVYAPMLVAASAGYDSANDRLRLLFGFGARFAVKRFAFAPSVDVGGVIDKVKTSAVGQGHENDLRLSFEFEIVPRVLSIVGGPSLALRSDSGNKLTPHPRWFAGLTLF